jgi:hypothetical protein
MTDILEGVLVMNDEAKALPSLGRWGTVRNIVRNTTFNGRREKEVLSCCKVS